MHIKRMHDMIEDLTSCTKNAIESEQTHVGKFPVSDVIDMIKDLCEAEYYARISKEMEECKKEEEEEDKYILKKLKEEYGEEEGRRYYDNYRYANGRFAPKGRGRRMGYPFPDYHMMPEYYPDRDMDIKEGRMYSPIIQGDNRYNNSSSRYGYSYDNYMNKRKGYSISEPSQKHERMKMMEEESTEIVEMISNMLEGVSPEEKNILKNKMTKVISTI